MQRGGRSVVEVNRARRAGLGVAFDHLAPSPGWYEPSEDDTAMAAGELRAIAGDRTGLLTETAGLLLSFYEGTSDGSQQAPTSASSDTGPKKASVVRRPGDYRRSADKEMSSHCGRDHLERRNQRSLRVKLSIR
jgi:hypothetical protein